MTTFEITTIVLLAIIAIMLLLIFAYMCWHFRSVESWQRSHYNELRVIRVKVDATAEYTQNHIAPDIEIISNNFLHLLDESVGLPALVDIVDKMHRNLCVEIADKMVNKMYPVNEGESFDAPFDPDYKLKKDIENKLNGFAAAVLDAECCPQEILDLWTERICESAHKFIKQFKIDWDKLSKEQQDEFLKRLIMPNYDSPSKPPFNPTCETTNNSNMACLEKGGEQ